MDRSQGHMSQTLSHMTPFWQRSAQVEVFCQDEYDSSIWLPIAHAVTLRANPI